MWEGSEIVPATQSGFRSSQLNAFPLPPAPSRSPDPISQFPSEPGAVIYAGCDTWVGAQKTYFHVLQQSSSPVCHGISVPIERPLGGRRGGDGRMRNGKKCWIHAKRFPLYCLSDSSNCKSYTDLT